MSVIEIFRQLSTCLLLFTAPPKWKKNGNGIETDQQDHGTDCFSIVSGQTPSNPQDAHDCRNWNYGPPLTPAHA